MSNTTTTAPTELHGNMTKQEILAFFKRRNWNCELYLQRAAGLTYETATVDDMYQYIPELTTHRFPERAKRFELILTGQAVLDTLNPNK
jgi:hypothetical protein